MSRGFVEVPADALRAALAELGMTRNPEARGREEVWDRAVGSSTVRCYTSITVGDAGARGCGEDAIRVVAFDSTRGLYKGKRVHRTGSVAAVIKRVRERAGEAFELALRNEARKGTKEAVMGEVKGAAKVQNEVDAFLAGADEPPTSEPPPESAPRAVAVKSTLNPEQQAVVDHDGGPCVVQAVAGCGKTHAVVERVARLVRSGVPGDKILAVTFSKKAADEMNHRLTRLGVTTARVGTWHSLALQVLKDDATAQGRWQIDERDRAKSILKEVLGYKNLNWKDVDFGQVRRFLTICKANLWAWDAPETTERAKQMFGWRAKDAVRAYELYDAMVQGAGLLTFDDFLVFTKAHLDVDVNRENWAAKWDYMIIDEYQDNNGAQNALAEQLVRVHRNLMVVGDCAQSIYAFRGSSPQHIVEFEQKWGAKRIAMIRNYRSGRAIIRVANDIIRPAQVRMPEEMVAERDVEGSVKVVRTPTFDAEGSEIVKWAQEHVGTGGSYTDCCVLFRTNAQSRAVEEAMLRAKIPYVLVGGVSFYERKEVKDLLGYLRVATGQDRDGDAVKRCINAPFRYLGKAFVERVMAAAKVREEMLRDCNCSEGWADIVRTAASQAGIQARQRQSAETWAALIEQVQEMTTPKERVMQSQIDQAEAGQTWVNETPIREMREERPDAILQWIVDRTGYIKAVEEDEGAESIESSGAANVREMIRVAREFRTAKELLAYVEATIRASQKQRKDGQAGGDRVLLMSVHRSKGLEWPKVWVVGCNEKILPHAKGDPEEERRLMYVAATRARDELVMSWVQSFATREGIREGVPSRFLHDAGLVTMEAAS